MSTCNEIIVAQQEVPVVPHTFGEFHSEIPATCLSAGVKGYKVCSVCEKNFDVDGIELSDLTIAQLTHSFTLEETTYETFADSATTTSGALFYKKCSLCSNMGDETFVHGAPYYAGGNSRLD